ncbi:MAG: nucleoside hydrolase [Loigolactobacillus coryniformis]|uniref:nucleoside hydrolase n=1 Tax=Loigolactobacillus coryniformis TaxID=1610 RepID=UPI002648C3CB|nr:nucleoside hydrolase [Loigolactobacillus coryniformis]MDN5952977.1 nucleoside hydrolase [Loigolactobacillus coryniformis]
MKLIYDCDSTIGIPGKDIDDGLTLLYLNQQPTVDLLGVTLTFGNGTVAQVQQQTTLLAKMFALSIDIYAGAEQGETNKKTAASQFLATTVRRYPHQVKILATGSLANLAAAAQLEPDFFDLVQQIVIMGGLFKPLTVNHFPVGELNFSVAPAAVAQVITGGAPLMLASGQYLATAIFGRRDLVLGNGSNHRQQWLEHTISDWMKVTQQMWQVDGFVNWDGVTALGLLQPELFEFETGYLAAPTPQLSKGMLQLAPAKTPQPVKLLVKIKDLAQVNQIFLQGLKAYFA